VKLPDDPSPVPAGMSAMLETSSDFPSMPKQAKRLAKNGMFDLLGSRHPLHPRVLHNQIVNEGFVHGDVHVFIDRRGDQETFMLLVIRR